MLESINNMLKSDYSKAHKMGQRINLVGGACPVKSNLLPLWHEIRKTIACHTPRYGSLRGDEKKVCDRTYCQV